MKIFLRYPSWTSHLNRLWWTGFPQTEVVSFPNVRSDDSAGDSAMQTQVGEYEQKDTELVAF